MGEGDVLHVGPVHQVLARAELVLRLAIARRFDETRPSLLIPRTEDACYKLSLVISVVCETLTGVVVFQDKICYALKNKE